MRSTSYSDEGTLSTSKSYPPPPKQLSLMPDQDSHEGDDSHIAVYCERHMPADTSALMYWDTCALMLWTGHGAVSALARRYIIPSQRNRLGDLPESLALRLLANQRRLHGRQEHLDAKLERIETLLDVGVQPVIAKLVRDHEWLLDTERDTLPPAASPDYEWGKRAVVILDTVEMLTEDFDDPPDRLSHHVKLIDQLKDILPLARSLGNRPLRSAVLTLHDALYSVYSEDLTQEQLSLIREMVGALQDADWDLDQVREFDKKLRDHGFETVPSDKSLAGGRV